MADYDGVLIYDGECPYCSVAAVALKRLDRVAVVSWDDDAAQSFLRAQFDAEPFAMFLVDRRRGRVYAGRSAAEELAERAGTPGIVSGLVRDNYDRIASLVTTVSGRARDADEDYHDVWPLADGAAALVDDLLANAEERPAALSAD
jgi:predicted DCC family thiol-disulfide oxidoreductase YuxK